MADSLLLILGGALLGLMLIFGLEQLVRPKLSLPWQRPAASLLLTMGLWFLLFSLFTAVLGRPIFSGLILLALWLLLVFANNAKYEALKEPFLFQDYDYIIDLFKHPRLFLPFLGVGRAIIIIIGIIIAVALGFGFEPAIVYNTPLILTFGTLGLLAIAFLLFGHKKLPPINTDPKNDILFLGLVAFYWAYAVAQFKSKPQLQSPFNPSDNNKNQHAVNATNKLLPHIIAVQSESFFDPRLLCTDINKALGAAFDGVALQAYQSGEVDVPAWGANTVRSEFAFLTGIAPSSLGVHGFNPYRLIHKNPTMSLVAAYKALGYRTIAIHPYPASFYARDRVYPLLGFDEFYDITHFEQAERFGPYVSDEALVEFISSLIGQSTQALFIFAVTMENHGPLHLESISQQEIDDLFQVPQPESCRDLAIYLRHWRNAGLMAEALMNLLKNNKNRPGKLAWYGDHVPVMDKVYQQYGMPSGRTPFLIFDTNIKPSIRSAQPKKTLKLEALGHFLINANAKGPQA